MFGIDLDDMRCPVCGKYGVGCSCGCSEPIPMSDEELANLKTDFSKEMELFFEGRNQLEKLTRLFK